MGANLNELKLECVAIGSLPNPDVNSAMTLVKENFGNIPFWPQMVKVSKNEDMILQFMEGMPSFFSDKSFLNTEYEAFYEDLEQLFLDYESITSENNQELLEKYAISDKYSVAFESFLNILKESKPKFAKGQIVGPFTLSTTLVDKFGRCAIYDETLKEIIVKILTLKALWQIKKMKEAYSEVVPIIFIDEPSISQLGTSAYMTISESEVIYMLREVSDAVKNFGAVCAIHCCGKCDWSVPIKSGINIINPDAFSYAENLSVFADEVDKFLKDGGKIAWGLVPTLDKAALASSNLEDIIEKFMQSVNYLTKKGIDEKLIIDNSLVSTSCGAGSLTVDFAEKAMKLTKELSLELKSRYN